MSSMKRERTKGEKKKNRGIRADVALPKQDPKLRICHDNQHEYRCRELIAHDLALTYI